MSVSQSFNFCCAVTVSVWSCYWIGEFCRRKARWAPAARLQSPTRGGSGRTYTGNFGFLLILASLGCSVCNTPISHTSSAHLAAAQRWVACLATFSLFPLETLSPLSIKTPQQQALAACSRAARLCVMRRIGRPFLIDGNILLECLAPCLHSFLIYLPSLNLYFMHWGILLS